MKAFRQERARAFNGAFAINPHRAGELFRRKEFIQVRKASRMREIVRRAWHDADIGVACGKGSGVVFAHGKTLRKVEEAAIVDVLMEEIGNL